MSSPFYPLASLMSHARPAETTVAFGRHQAWSWQQFHHHVHTLTQELARAPDQRVALCFNDSFLFSVAFFACCHAGKSLVLPGNHQPEALAEIAHHYDLLLSDDALSQILSLPSQETWSQSEFAPLDAEQVTLTLFTSGSSGQPKAIEKTLAQLDAEIALLEQLWGTSCAGARIESTVSHQHIYGLLFRLLWPLCAGRAFATHNLEFPEQIAAHAHPDVVLISSPALLKRLGDDMASTPLRACFSSGGPLPLSAAHHSQRGFGTLPYEVFGSTETGGIAYRQQHDVNALWTLLPGVKAQLNAEGCLRLRSPHLDPLHWYQTADACRFHSTEQFELLGRTDRVVKIEEKRISLVEVEKRVEQLPWVSEAVVLPIWADDRLCLACALVLNREGNHSMHQLGKGKFWLQLRQALRGWIEPIAIPRKYRVVAEIPLNSQGKRLSQQIEALFVDDEHAHDNPIKE